MEQDCMSLSIEGERLLKAQDYQGAINYFEAGLRAGTDDQEILSAVYNQLGNACFYIGKFHKALEYHKKDLEIAQKLGDRAGQAKAYGNLGNTFKSLKNYPNAIKCCESHLEITIELKDKLGEGRACYNLGNVHHAVGKAALSQKTDEGNTAGRKSVTEAITYYKKTLEITTSLNDKSGEGRALGNLGNAYTAVGDYAEAIKYHERRLALAEEAKDLAAKARACGNLGNAYSALGSDDPSNFSQALKYYQQSLAVAKDSGNVPGQGQAYYCIGSTYTMLKNHVKAIEYFEQHLEIATNLNDKTGMLRAWYNLRNACHATGDMPRTVEYHKLIQANGGAVAPLRQAQAPGAAQPPQPNNSGGAGAKTLRGSEKKLAKQKQKAAKKPAKEKTNSNAVQAFSVSDSEDSDDEIVRYRKGDEPKIESARTAADAWLDAAIAQVADLPEGEDLPQNEDSGTVPEFFNSIPAAPSTKFAKKSKNTLKSTKKSKQSVPKPAEPGSEPIETLADDDAFFDLLVKIQGSQIDGQRAAVGGDAPEKQSVNIAEKLDADNMSFFDMLQAAKQ